MKKTARKICILLLGFTIANTIGCSNQTPETTTTESESINPTLDSEYVNETFKVITQEDEKKAVFLITDDDYDRDLGERLYSLYVIDNQGNIYYYKATTVIKEIDFSEILEQEPIDFVIADEVDEVYALLLDLNKDADLIELSFSGVPEYETKEYYGIRYLNDDSSELICLFTEDEYQHIHPSKEAEEIMRFMKNWFIDEKYHQYDNCNRRKE